MLRQSSWNVSWPLLANVYALSSLWGGARMLICLAIELTAVIPPDKLFLGMLVDRAGSLAIQRQALEIDASEVQGVVQ